MLQPSDSQGIFGAFWYIGWYTNRPPIVRPKMPGQYLVRRSSGPYFRIRVPNPLRDALGRDEIKKSLTELPIREARAVASALGCGLRRLFEEIEEQMSKLNESDIRAAVDNWIDREHRRLVSEYRLARFEGRQPESREWFQPVPRDEEEAIEIGGGWVGPGDFALEALEAIERGTPKEAAKAYQAWRETASAVAKSVGLDLSELPKELQAIAIQTVLKGFFRLQQRVNENGADPRPPEKSLQTPTERIKRAEQPEPAGTPKVSLEEAWELYCKEMKDTGAGPWQDGAPEHAEWARNDLFQLYGRDRDVCSIQRQDLIEYRNVLQTRYPANRSRVKEYRDRTLAELAAGAEIPEHRRISSVTKQSRLQHTRRFFEFVKNYGLRPDNPAESVQIKESDKNKGEPWTSKEIQTILASERLHEQFLEDSAQFCPGGLFWLVSVLAYTGARQREIMGLRFCDFELDSEAPVLWIREHDTRKLKTNQSSRWVPIHNDLISMGFAEWIAWRQEQGAESPWPHTKKSGEYWGRRFRNAVTAPLGYHAHRSKTMHSFRHSFISACIGKGVPDNVRHLITGHKESGTDWDHYIHQTDDDRELYSKYVNRISYGLDLDRLAELWRSSLPRT